jgi:hypothetical protein
MASKPLSVLRVNSVEETADYRRAVSSVLAHIMRDHTIALVDIAESIDVSLGTISNAFNRKSDLSPTYCQRLAKAFGPEVLNPIAALSGGRVVPLDATDQDALPSLSASIHRLAVAQSPDSPGGSSIIHSELLSMMPELRAAVSALNALIVRGERIAA